MDDLLLTLFLLGGLIGLLTVVAWAAHRVFSWISNRLPWRRPPGWAKGTSLPTAPWWAIDPLRASYQMALHEWGTKIIATGREWGMGWQELLFQIDPPVAGVSGVTTITGDVLFTPRLRCMIIVDRAQITMLDREKQRGISLTASLPRQNIRMTLDGTVMEIRFLETVGDELSTANLGAFTERSFSVDLHAEQASDLVPPGWPGKAVLLPQPAAAPSAIESR